MAFALVKEHAILASLASSAPGAGRGRRRLGAVKVALPWGHAATPCAQVVERAAAEQLAPDAVSLPAPPAGLRRFLGNHPDVNVAETHGMGANDPFARFGGVGHVLAPALIERLYGPRILAGQFQPL